MIKECGMLSDVLGRVTIPFVPFIMERAVASSSTNEILTNSGLRFIATEYSYLLLITASLIFLIIGSIIGYFYPTPEYGLKAYPKQLKLLISVGGGVLAFIYYIETQKDLTPTVIIWVACVSFVFPAIIHLIHAFIVKFIQNKMNLSDNDIKRISEHLDNQESKEK